MKPVFAFVPGTDIGGFIYEGMPCIVCQQTVLPGTGAQAMPPFPALHSKCAVAAVGKIEKQE